MTGLLLTLASLVGITLAWAATQLCKVIATQIEEKGR